MAAIVVAALARDLNPLTDAQRCLIGFRCIRGRSRMIRAPEQGLSMTKPIARYPIFHRRVFDAEIIELCVRWYITYRLSYRDLVGMVAEREVTVAHSTILRWVTRFVPEDEERWSRFSRRAPMRRIYHG